MAAGGAYFAQPAAMTLYRFHWPDGVSHEGRGRSVAEALRSLGFPPAAAKTMVYYEVLEDTAADQERDAMIKQAYQ